MYQFGEGCKAISEVLELCWITVWVVNTKWRKLNEEIAKLDLMEEYQARNHINTGWSPWTLGSYSMDRWVKNFLRGDKLSYIWILEICNNVICIVKHIGAALGHEWLAIIEGGMSSAKYYRLFRRRMSEYLYSRLSVIGWCQTIIQNMDTFLSEWLRRKHFWKMFWSYIVKVLSWILLWQDLKRAVWTWRPTKNSSARQLELQFLGSSVFRIEKANVVMKTSFCLFAFSQAHSCGSTISTRSFREPRTSCQISLNTSVSTSMGGRHMDEVYAAFLQRALLYSPSRGETRHHNVSILHFLSVTKYIIGLTNSISDRKECGILKCFCH